MFGIGWVRYLTNIDYKLTARRSTYSALLKNTFTGQPAIPVPDFPRDTSVPTVTITPQELRAVLDLAALANRPVGEAFRLHDVLLRTAQLADQKHPIGVVVPYPEEGGVSDSKELSWWGGEEMDE